MKFANANGAGGSAQDRLKAGPARAGWSGSAHFPRKIGDILVDDEDQEKNYKKNTASEYLEDLEEIPQADARIVKKNFHKMLWF